LAVGERVEETRARDSLTGPRPMIAGLVTTWEKEQLQWQPWDEGTKRNYLCRMRRISRELGDRLIAAPRNQLHANRWARFDGR
jgi:hypothetical protein